MREVPLFSLNAALNLLLGLTVTIALCVLFLLRIRKYQQELVEHAEQRVSEQKECEKLEAMKNISGGIAHLINNEMQIVGANTYLLKAGTADEEKRQRLIEMINMVSLQVSSHANQLLQYANNSPISLKPIDLNAVIRKWENDIFTDASAEKIKFNSTLNQVARPCLVDQKLLIHGLDGLLENAREACEKAGSIEISIKEGAGETVVISIQDTGHGMSQETLEHAFEPFYTTHFTGRGLGLAAAKGIIEAHSGTIIINSIEKKGTSVIVTMPLAKHEHHQ